jgi:hypothetical protein
MAPIGTTAVLQILHVVMRIKVHNPVALPGSFGDA